jgi:hypothetical protein
MSIAPAEAVLEVAHQLIPIAAKMRIVDRRLPRIGTALKRFESLGTFSFD